MQELMMVVAVAGMVVFPALVARISGQPASESEADAVTGQAGRLIPARMLPARQNPGRCLTRSPKLAGR